jgi:hypothetical protein
MPSEPLGRMLAVGQMTWPGSRKWQIWLTAN